MKSFVLWVGQWCFHWFNSSGVHWFNTGFTLATITSHVEVGLKVAAFLFVTLPLGYVQWTSAVERWRERHKKHVK